MPGSIARKTVNFPIKTPGFDDLYRMYAKARLD